MNQLIENTAAPVVALLPLEHDIPCEDFSRMEALYGKETSQAIIGSFGNQFFGQVNNYPTAELISKIFGKEEKLTAGYNQGEQSSGWGNNYSKGTNYS